MEDIDWNDPKCKISKYFTVHEALWLPSFRCYHNPTEEERREIVMLAKTIDIIRLRIGRPIIVHCWIRPTSVNACNTRYHGKNYNKYIGSTSTKSAHIFGMGVDFHVSGFAGPKGCEIIRQKILPLLEGLNIRMEYGPDCPWIHIDTAPVKISRFFKP